MVPAEVEQAVGQYPAHFLPGRNAQLPGIIGYALNADKDVAFDFASGLALIERDDVGVVIVLEVVAVNLQQVLVGAENVVQITHGIPLTFGLLAEPLAG